MSSNDFLKELLKAGEEVSDKPAGKTVAKVKFEIGFSGFCSGHSMASLFRPMTEPGKNEEVKNAVSEHVKSLGGRGGAIVGLRYTVPFKNIISFEAEFGKERFVQRYGEEDDFDQIWKAIDELGIEINAWQWVAYHSIESPSAVAKGENGKFATQSGERVFPKIIIPVEKFANEEAARAAVGSNSTSSSSGWSEKLKQNYEDISAFESNVGEIQTAWTKISKGELPWEGAPALPKPLTPSKLKEYLGRDDMFSCESGDIDLALEMTPF